MNGRFELHNHLVVGQLADEVKGHELIFQPIVNQIVGSDALVEQTLHLIEHAVGEPLAQARTDARPSRVAIDRQTDVERLHHRKITASGFALEVVRFDFYGSDCSLTRIHVGGVVQHRTRTGFQRRQFGRQFRQRPSLERGTERRILRNVADVVIAHHTLHVQARAATHHRALSATADVLKGIEEIVLIAIEVVFRPGFDNVDQMVGHPSPRDAIIVEVLARAEIHAPIHLTRICADDLRIDAIGQSHDKRSFAAGRGSHHRHEVEIRKRGKC